METKIIKGDQVRDRILMEVAAEIAALSQKYNRVPGIAFLGFNCIPLSKYNIPLHIELAQSVGLKVTTEIMGEDATEEQVFGIIRRWNSDENIHAIVLLQPLPAHLVPVRIVNAIDPRKEVEGFHPLNMLATMVPDTGTARYPMCLPQALFEMFSDAGLGLLPDQEWVFLLDDEFVHNTLTRMIARTAAARVVPPGSNVTFVNRESSHLVEHCKRADVLVVITKVPGYVRPEWLKPGVWIIDIYSNLVKEVPAKADPARLVPVIRGGVNVHEAESVAGVLLPIPGGLMTVVMAVMFRNTVISFRNSCG